MENGGLEGWMSSDGERWVRVDQAYGFAVRPVFVDAGDGMVQMNGGAPGQLELDVDENLVVATALLPVAPNPFNPSTEIRFTLKERDRVRISVFDLKGHRIADLVNEEFPGGRHSVTWQGHDQNGRQVASGAYFVRFQAGESNFTRRMLLVK